MSLPPKEPPKDLPAEDGQLYVKANSFLETHRAKEAEEILLGIAERNPNASSIWGLLGVCYYDQLHFDKAYQSFRNIAEKANNRSFYAFKTGFLDLLAGDYHNGWQLYMERKRLPLPLPLLDGKNAGSFKHLLVLREQGYGDIIQFARFLHPLRNVFPNRKITFLCPPPMLRLLNNYARNLNINLIHDLEEDKIKDYGFDAYTHLCSLPIHMDMKKQHVGLVGNLFSYDKARAEELRLKMPTPTIGLCWAGRKGYPRFYNRDCDNSEVEHLIDSLPGAKFVSLMKPDVELPDESKKIYDHPRVDISYAEEIKDFYDLATLIKAVDIVVTVDSAPLHVSATLGKPTYCLLGYAPDWRWMMGQRDSLWYPACKLFRQMRPGEWRIPIEDLVEQLGRDLPSALEKGEAL